MYVDSVCLAVCALCCICRYNRRVKPNRRYTSPTRDSGSSSSHDDSEQNINSGKKLKVDLS